MRPPEMQGDTKMLIMMTTMISTTKARALMMMIPAPKSCQQRCSRMPKR